MTEVRWLACNEFTFLEDARGHATCRGTPRQWRLATLALANWVPLRLRCAEYTRALDLAESVLEGRSTLAGAGSFLATLWRYRDARRSDERGVRCRLALEILAQNKQAACAREAGERFLRMREMIQGVVDLLAFDEQLRSRGKELGSGKRRRMVEPVCCDILRDVLGNSFRPVAFDPNWRTDTAVSLAAQMYEARDFSALPILADALQDAGCDDQEVLAHCRGPGPHVRGCWAIDRVLGKE